MPIPKALVGLGMAAAVLAKEELERRAEEMRERKRRRKRGKRK